MSVVNKWGLLITLLALSAAGCKNHGGPGNGTTTGATTASATTGGTTVGGSTTGATTTGGTTTGGTTTGGATTGLTTTTTGGFTTTTTTGLVTTTTTGTTTGFTTTTTGTTTGLTTGLTTGTTTSGTTTGGGVRAQVVIVNNSGFEIGVRINQQNVTSVQPNGSSTVFTIDPGISLPVEVEAVLAVPPNRITTHNCTFESGVSYSITYTDDGMSVPTIECVASP